MGKPKFPRRKYAKPLHPWKEERIKTEKELIRKYGLKNHKEVWKAKTLLRKYRAQARELLGKISGSDPQVKKESEQLLLRLTRINLLPENPTLDDVLSLDVENILARRLQTLVYHRGLATTIKHARQLITHGHIAVGSRKVTIPGYIVTKDEDNLITYNPCSPLNTTSHPARPKTEIQKIVTTTQSTQIIEPVKTEIKEDITPAKKPDITDLTEKKDETPSKKTTEEIKTSIPEDEGKVEISPDKTEQKTTVEKQPSEPPQKKHLKKKKNRIK
ncbi:MAG: 30S ribosomal protein S4 [Candidatus Thermoplasmatota archaeon]